MRNLLSLILIALAAGALCQDQVQPLKPAVPIIPKTPDVVVPPALNLPSPGQLELGMQPLGVTEAVQIALQKQAQIGIARGNLLSAQGKVQSTASSLYPQLGATAGYADQRVLVGPSGGPVKDRFTAGVNVNQLLFDFGRTRDQVRQQEALTRASVQTLNRTQQDVASLTRQDFYTLVQAIANVQIGEENVANRQRQLDEANAKVTTGISAPSDLIQAKTNLADAVISLVQARDALLLARVALAQQLGVDPRTPIIPAPSHEPDLTNASELQQLVSTALNNRSDVLSAREQLAAAHFGVSVAQKTNLPKIEAVAGLGGRGLNDPFSSQTATFGLNLTWNFADSGLTAGEVKTARGNELSAQQNLIFVSQQAITDVSNAFVDLQSAQQRLSLAQVEVANATELVRISEGRYEGGLGLFLDITNAQNSLFTAQRSLTQAQGDLDRARARLRNAVGLV